MPNDFLPSYRLARFARCNMALPRCLGINTVQRIAANREISGYSFNGWAASRRVTVSFPATRGQRRGSERRPKGAKWFGEPFRAANAASASERLGSAHGASPEQEIEADRAEEEGTKNSYAQATDFSFGAPLKQSAGIGNGGAATRFGGAHSPSASVGSLNKRVKRNATPTIIT